MNMIILLFVIGLVSITLLAPLANEIERVTNSGNSTNPVATNITGASLTLIDLLPLFFAIFILLIFVAGMKLRSRR